MTGALPKGRAPTADTKSRSMCYVLSMNKLSSRGRTPKGFNEVMPADGGGWMVKAGERVPSASTNGRRMR